MKTGYKVAFGGIISALVLAGVMGQAARPSTHNALAVINISKVFTSLNEKIHDDSDIDAMAKKVNDEKAKRDQELENLQQQLQSNTLFKEDSPEYRKMQDDALEKSMEMDSFLKMSQAKLLMEQRLRTIQIYKAIVDAVQRYAEANGIGIVLVGDDVDFSKTQSTEAVQQKIAVRKVMYSHPDFDITQKVIEKMNGEYKLSGG
jgi:Skp family chaperone for outer membrane proteins